MSLLRDYDVTWPNSTIQLLSYSDSFNVGISITAPQCFVPGYNFFLFYIATMAQPVGLPEASLYIVHIIMGSHVEITFLEWISNPWDVHCRTPFLLGCEASNRTKSHSPAAACLGAFASPTVCYACLQALALMLCAGIYLLANSSFRSTIVPPGPKSSYTCLLLHSPNPTHA